MRYCFLEIFQNIWSHFHESMQIITETYALSLVVYKCTFMILLWLLLHTAFLCVQSQFLKYRCWWNTTSTTSEESMQRSGQIHILPGIILYKTELSKKLVKIRKVYHKILHLIRLKSLNTILSVQWHNEIVSIVKCQADLVLKWFSNTPWRSMAEWKYRSVLIHILDLGTSWRWVLG
jgi:hypothetical protein